MTACNTLSKVIDKPCPGRFIRIPELEYSALVKNRLVKIRRFEVRDIILNKIALTEK